MSESSRSTSSTWVRVPSGHFDDEALTARVAIGRAFARLFGDLDGDLLAAGRREPRKQRGLAAGQARTVRAVHGHTVELQRDLREPLVVGAPDHAHFDRRPEERLVPARSFLARAPESARP